MIEVTQNLHSTLHYVVTLLAMISLFFIAFLVDDAESKKLKKR